jgi:DNA modification methylase
LTGKKYSKSYLSSLPGQATGVSMIAESKMLREHREFLKRSELSGLAENFSWTVEGSNAAINYSTHGIYRYFGKFPAPIGRQLMLDYSKPGGVVVDPACGSGTTGVEALWMENDAYLFDLNPLSVLISKVKTTPISAKRMESASEKFQQRYKSIRKGSFEPVGIDLEHWFLPETARSLSRMRNAIDEETNRELRNFLEMNFAAIVRKVSKATTQQGRLFLDIETAVPDPLPVLLKSIGKSIENISKLPKTSSVHIQKADILNNESLNKINADLVIYHPPYFNAYKYSSINSLELAWIQQDRKVFSKQEIREFFKVGKPENSKFYVEDMAKSILNLQKFMGKNTRLAIMIGDALMKEQHLTVTREIIDLVSEHFEVERTVLRVPKYTEASWATSQRRSSGSLGITMFDFILTLRKKK